MSNVINPNDAPKGFKAIPDNGTLATCEGCYFYKTAGKRSCINDDDIRCTPNVRDDNRLVIFEKLKDESNER